jgi:hypothetical protein
MPYQGAMTTRHYADDRSVTESFAGQAKAQLAASSWSLIEHKRNETILQF